MPELFTNNATSSLASGIASGDTSLSVQAGDGALYPNPTAPDFFRAVLFKRSTAEIEIVLVTARSSDVFTITRAQESTTALDLDAGDLVELRPTAGFFSSLSVTDEQVQRDAYSVAGADSGSANNYAVTMSPTLTAYTAGLRVIFTPGADNTGASTINIDSLGTKSILRHDGSALVAGDINASEPTEIRYDGTQFRLQIAGLKHAAQADSATTLNGMTAAVAEVNATCDGNTATAAEITQVCHGNAATAAEITAICHNRTLASSDDKIDNFPAGTIMLFQQTSAPTGWTKQTTHNDKALRVVSGAAANGGSSPFSTVFGISNTDEHTLASSEIPDHKHETAVARGGAGGYVATGEPDFTGSGISRSCRTASDAGTYTRETVLSGLMANAVAGSGHSHGINLQVSYIDIILASKD